MRVRAEGATCSVAILAACCAALSAAVAAAAPIPRAQTCLADRREHLCVAAPLGCAPSTGESLEEVGYRRKQSRALEMAMAAGEVEGGAPSGQRGRWLRRR